MTRRLFKCRVGAVIVVLTFIMNAQRGLIKDAWQQSVYIRLCVAVASWYLEFPSVDKIITIRLRRSVGYCFLNNGREHSPHPVGQLGMINYISNVKPLECLINNSNTYYDNIISAPSLIMSVFTGVFVSRETFLLTSSLSFHMCSRSSFHHCIHTIPRVFVYSHRAGYWFKL